MKLDEGARPGALRLLLVDDHEMVRVGLRALLHRNPEFEIVGEAGTVGEAVDLAGVLRPDVVLLDLRLPDGSGLDACREILSMAPATRILFLTSHSDRDAALSTILAGAAGYLLKDLSYQSLVHAIREASAGRPIMDDKVSAPALEHVRRLVNAKALTAGNGEALSVQERRILALVVQGKTNKEIAAGIGLSDKTVKNYLSNAFQKMGVSRRSQAAAVFVQTAPLAPNKGGK